VRRQQVARTLDEAVASLYAGPLAGRTAGCFRETAYLFWKAGREEDARAALAAAQALDAGPEASAGIARAILEVTLAPVLERLETEIAGEEEGSRLVKT
jgi:hypothetical protein